MRLGYAKLRCCCYHDAAASLFGDIVIYFGDSRRRHAQKLSDNGVRFYRRNADYART